MPKPTYMLVRAKTVSDNPINSKLTATIVLANVNFNAFIFYPFFFIFSRFFIGLDAFGRPFIANYIEKNYTI